MSLSPRKAARNASKKKNRKVQVVTLKGGNKVMVMKPSYAEKIRASRADPLYESYRIVDNWLDARPPTLGCDHFDPFPRAIS